MFLNVVGGPSQQGLGDGKPNLDVGGSLIPLEHGTQSTSLLAKGGGTYLNPNLKYIDVLTSIFISLSVCLTWYTCFC